MSFNSLNLLDNKDDLTIEDVGFRTSTVALDALSQYNLTTGLLNEARKADQNLYAALDDTSMNAEEIADYVGSKESSLDVSGITSISRQALDMMIQDKKDEEKSAIYNQYRKDGLLSNISYYSAAFVGQMLDPIAVLTGAALVKTSASIGSASMKAFATSVARSTTRSGKFVAGAKVGAVFGTAEALLTEPLFYAMAQMRQENYGVDDSALNIAFGAVAGSVFGTVGSAFSKVRVPKSVEGIKSVEASRVLKTAHNQAVVGNKVNIEPILKVDPVNNYNMKVDKLKTEKGVNDLLKVSKEEAIDPKKGTKKQSVSKEKVKIKDTNEDIIMMRELIAKIRSEGSLTGGRRVAILSKRLDKLENRLDKGVLPDYNELPSQIRRQINNKALISKDPEVNDLINNLDVKDRVETIEKIEEVEPEVLEKIESEDFDKIYDEIAHATDNEFDLLSDSEFESITTKVRECIL